MVTELGPIRVVMVDDDPDDIFLTKTLFKRSDVEIDFKGVTSGKALYDLIKYNGIGSIDVILLDVNMPVENGYEVLKKLKAYPNIDDISILMFSTTRRSHEKELALEIGANDFVEKPSGVQDARNFIETITSHYTQKSKAEQAA